MKRKDFSNTSLDKYKLTSPFPIPDLSHSRRNLSPNVHDCVIIFFKKHLKTLTKIAFIGSVSRIIIPAALAASPAEPVIAAFMTCFINHPRTLDKPDFFTALINLIQPVFIKIPKTIFIQHVEITGIDASVRLGYILNTTYAALVAGFCHVSGSQADIILELPDIWLFLMLQVTIPEEEQIN